jgi:hypothetical protein
MKANNIKFKYSATVVEEVWAMLAGLTPRIKTIVAATYTTKVRY